MFRTQKSCVSGNSKCFLCAQHAFKNVVTLKNFLSTSNYSVYVTISWKILHYLKYLVPPPGTREVLTAPVSESMLVLFQNIRSRPPFNAAFMF